MDARTNPTIAEQAYNLLRADILNGRFKPDMPLRLEALKELYGFSFTPMREALTRLRGDGLVEQTSLRGFRTAKLSLEEMWDIINTRIFIECEAVKQAIENGNDDWEARIVASMYSLSKQIEKGVNSPEDRELFETRHGDFHVALISACGSPSLLKLAYNFWLLSERYRRPHLFQYSSTSDLIGEHAQLKEAVLSRNVERAQAVLKNHYMNTGRFVESLLTQPFHDAVNFPA
jgi:DNA-binding GntR family transcriptional regulator